MFLEASIRADDDKPVETKIRGRRVRLVEADGVRIISRVPIHISPLRAQLLRELNPSCAEPPADQD